MNNDVVKSALPADVKFFLVWKKKQQKVTSGSFLYMLSKQCPVAKKHRWKVKALKKLKQDFDEMGRPAIKMQMTPTGSKTWASLTAKNVDRPIAIALDDIVYSAPNVNGAIEGGNSEISGSFTVEEAQDLANILKSGKLDAPAKIVAEQIVGPTLGKEAVTWRCYGIRHRICCDLHLDACLL